MAYIMVEQYDRDACHPMATKFPADFMFRMFPRVFDNL